jgi:predicted nucleotidyltransferase component of viral defense system
MIKDIIKNRLKEYSPETEIEQQNILQEIVQYYILAGLSKTGFFNEAIFHGGTFLRIVHQIDRFSEDLDFLLKKTDLHFLWKPYIDRIQTDLHAEGLDFEVKDRSQSNVKKAFLKTDSIGKILLIELPFQRLRAQKLLIKLEIDSNPPAGSTFETHYLNFPTIAPITTQTLESSFSLKSHALLCREYVKGRDWYDFLWYIRRKTGINFQLLRNALVQQGPWKGQNISIDQSWYLEKMADTIKTIDWKKAKEDVVRFIPVKASSQLAHWNADLFLYFLHQMKKQG